VPRAAGPAGSECDRRTVGHADVPAAAGRYLLTSAQYALLASLYALHRGGARPSQRELAAFSGLDTMYVSKLIRVLERGGLVERMANPADSRAVLLTVTDTGEQAVQAARAAVVGLEEQRLAVLGGRTSLQSAALRDALTLLLRDAGATPGAESPAASTKEEP
jgi:MarR family transcriptional regulator, organic hydroperoxide resistance regulator